MMNTMVEVLFILDHRLRDQVQRNFSLKKVCDESKLHPHFLFHEHPSFHLTTKQNLLGKA